MIMCETFLDVQFTVFSTLVAFHGPCLFQFRECSPSRPHVVAGRRELCSSVFTWPQLASGRENSPKHVHVIFPTMLQADPTTSLPLYSQAHAHA